MISILRVVCQSRSNDQNVTCFRPIRVVLRINIMSFESQTQSDPQSFRCGCENMSSTSHLLFHWMQFMTRSLSIKIHDDINVPFIDEKPLFVMEVVNASFFSPFDQNESRHQCRWIICTLAIVM